MPGIILESVALNGLDAACCRRQTDLEAKKIFWLDIAISWPPRMLSFFLLMKESTNSCTLNCSSISDALHYALLIQNLDFSELALNGMLHEAVECVIACTYIVSVTIESLQH